MKKYTDEEMSKMNKEASDMRKQNQKMSYCNICKAIVKSDELDEWTRQCTQCKTITKYEMGWIGQTQTKVVKND